VDYVITWLEMTERPRRPVPSLPAGQHAALLAAKSPPVGYFLYLYRAVGASYEWTDWLMRPVEQAEAFIGDPQVGLHTMLLDGWPGGFFILDSRRPGTVDLSYFGLVPQAIGRGLGHWLLGAAVDTAWQIPGVTRLTVNTNTLDHPRALGLYQKLGFRPIRRESHRRQLTRERTEAD
ncbi:MAG TPA: GNAT family N-acetyltransferase, partial [Paracoccaceae bacterium]|nr:GNAT family N-acetyltransferase [Paracoccaceae bacterium]